MAYDFQVFKQKVDKALAHINQEISTLRTGKASLQLVDPVMVEAYGTRMKLNEVANVSVPDSNLIMISPWDKSLLGAIEKGIQVSGINLNPVVEGTIIRLIVPPLTEERRKDMVKILHQKIESGKIMLRTVRTDTKKEIDQMKGQPGVSEDAIEQDLQTLEDKLKQALAQVDVLAVEKEKDLMTI